MFVSVCVYRHAHKHSSHIYTCVYMYIKIYISIYVCLYINTKYGLSMYMKIVVFYFTVLQN